MTTTETRRCRPHGRVAGFLSAFAFAALASVPPPLHAQDAEERFPGVTLGLTYETAYQPVLAIQPFTGRLGGAGVASRVEAIVGRDLRYSNRFRLLDRTPEGLQRGDEVDYSFWDQLGADWLLTGRVEGAGDGFVLVLELHDVVYREAEEQGRFRVPDPNSDDFRMAVHLASDAVVEWVFDEPGIAATRIAFTQRRSDGNQDVYIVDSDGENLRRVTNHRSLTISPAWSPDGRRVAYTSYRTGYPRIYELNLETGEEKQVPANRSGDYITPSYHPNGREIIFSVVGSGRSGIFSYDIQDECCLRNITEGRWDDISPRYSPDGRFIAFNSNRLGMGTPQIYQMPASGGRAELISPYLYGEYGYYTSPDWSPVGNRVAFHGRVTQGGRHQILVSEVEGRRSRVAQLTTDGNNQDPRWAPDGRHLVFVGERSWGHGVFIVDAATGNVRTLVSGIRARVPDWSPSLAPLIRERIETVDR